MSTITPVSSDDLFRLNRFYRRNGHKGKAQPGDTAFWLREEENVLAALRFSVNDDSLLLRGLWVHKAHRGQGRGSLLLRGCKDFWGTHTCYCYPFSHLEKFYAGLGFSRADARTPAPYLRKLETYQQRGEDVILMRYQPPCD